MGCGASTGRCRKDRFLSIGSTPSLCPPVTAAAKDESNDIRSIDRRPESVKKADRDNIAKKLAIADQKAKDADAKTRELERQVRELTVVNSELKQELVWSKKSPPTSNALDYSFNQGPGADAEAQILEKNETITKLEAEVRKLQDDLEQSRNSEAISAVQLLDLKHFKEEQQRRIYDLEDLLHNQREMGSLVSVSPTHGETLDLVVEEPQPPRPSILTTDSRSPKLELRPPVKSNMRTVSAQTRKLSPSGSKQRPLSTQSEQLRGVGGRSKRLSEKISQELGRAIEEKELDVQDILDMDTKRPHIITTVIGRDATEPLRLNPNAEIRKPPPKLAFQ